MSKTLVDSPTVRRVLRGELCTGCGLCASVSGGTIRMRSEPPGYNRPELLGPISVAAEQMIADACPGAAVAPWSGSHDIHPYWGPLRRVMTGAAVDETVRFEGSSGGAISALLMHALHSGLVDRVVHVGADPARPTQNATVVSRTTREVITGAGSRYTASSPLAILEEELTKGGRMAFVAKPCDISALRRAARHDPRIDAQVPLMLSFFCGGIPSHDGVGRILEAMGLADAAISAFRYRGQGWPGQCVAQSEDGRRGEMSYHDSWGRYLSREVQFRCKICPDAVGGVADIACADAWYGDESGYPKFEEEEGRSLIISRTEAGERLLESAFAAGVLSASPLPVEEIEKMQPAQARRKRLVQARVAALPLLAQPKPRMKELRVAEAARRATPSESIRNMVGTLRRTLQGRRSRL